VRSTTSLFTTPCTSIQNFWRFSRSNRVAMKHFRAGRRRAAPASASAPHACLLKAALRLPNTLRPETPRAPRCPVRARYGPLVRPPFVRPLAPRGAAVGPSVMSRHARRLLRGRCPFASSRRPSPPLRRARRRRPCPPPPQNPWFRSPSPPDDALRTFTSSHSNYHHL
jgi:hypothetical protein